MLFDAINIRVNFAKDYFCIRLFNFRQHDSKINKSGFIYCIFLFNITYACVRIHITLYFLYVTSLQFTYQPTSQQATSPHQARSVFPAWCVLQGTSVTPLPAGGKAADTPRCLHVEAHTRIATLWKVTDYKGKREAP